MNQIAVTLNLLWKDNFEISIDFALVIPAKKKPLLHDFDVYISQQVKSKPLENNNYDVPLQESEEVYNYIIRSYKTCRLSCGMYETIMFNQYPTDSIIKQSIRVCKKLRDIYMKHYFDVATESINPIMPSYWIKTVAMHLFKISDPIEYGDDPSDVCLSKCVIGILSALCKCLTGDEEKKPPFLASYNLPFKNLLSSAGSIDKNAYVLDDELKEIICNPHIITANDIKNLLEILQRLQQNDKWAKEDLEAMRKRNDSDKTALLEKGKREVLSILVFNKYYREMILGDSEGEKSSFTEFIQNNLPTIQVVFLDEEVEIDIDGMDVPVDIQLVENGVVIDLVELIKTAKKRHQYYILEKNDKNREDHFA